MSLFLPPISAFYSLDLHTHHGSFFLFTVRSLM
jgi:hypothetical protein